MYNSPNLYFIFIIIFINFLKVWALSLIGRVSNCRLGIFQFESGRARFFFVFFFFFIFLTKNKGKEGDLLFYGLKILEMKFLKLNF